MCRKKQAQKRLFAKRIAGEGRLDILVNNAGAGGRHLGAHAENMSLDDWDIIVRTHLRSTFLCSKLSR